MNIVEPTSDDLTIDDAAAVAGRSAKTLRRAVHGDQLPCRYMMGPRGPQLIFRRIDLQEWLGLKRRRALRQRRAASTGDASRGRAASTERGSLLETVGRLQAVVDEQRQAIDRLSSDLQDQHGTLIKAQETITQLVERIAGLESR